MNKEPNEREPSARRGTTPRSGTGPQPARVPDREESARVPGVRLDLPIQGPTIERRWDFYEPYMQVVGTYPVVDHPGTTGQYVEEPLPKSMFGNVVADPTASAGRDARGWSCPPSGPCVWVGIV